MPIQNSVRMSVDEGLKDALILEAQKHNQSNKQSEESKEMNDKQAEDTVTREEAPATILAVKEDKPTATQIVGNALSALSKQVDKETELKLIGEACGNIDKGLDPQTITFGIMGKLMQSNNQEEEKQEKQVFDSTKVMATSNEQKPTQYSAFNVEVAKAIKGGLKGAQFGADESVDQCLNSESKEAFEARSHNSGTGSFGGGFSSLLQAKEGVNHNFAVTHSNGDSEGGVLADTRSIPIVEKFYVPALIEALGVGVEISTGMNLWKSVAVVVEDADDKVMQKGENESAEITDLTFAHNEFGPKRVTTQIEISEMAIKTNSQNINLIDLSERMIRKQVMKHMSNQILTGDGTGHNVLGLNSMTAVSANLTTAGPIDLAAYRKLKATFEEQGLDYESSSTRILTHKVIADSLKTISWIPDSGNSLWQGDNTQNASTLGRIDDYPAFTPSNMPKNGENYIAMMLQVQDLILVYWDDASFVVDPFLKAGEGKIVITMNGYWNFGERYNGASGITKMTNITG